MFKKIRDGRFFTDIDDINTKNEWDWTPIMFAIRYNNRKMFEWLIEQPNIDINHKAAEGWTALHEAVYWDKMYYIKPLLKKGAKNLPDRHGITPRIESLRSRSKEVRDVLSCFSEFDKNHEYNRIEKEIDHSRKVKTVKKFLNNLPIMECSDFNFKNDFFIKSVGLKQVLKVTKNQKLKKIIEDVYENIKKEMDVDQYVFHTLDLKFQTFNEGDLSTTGGWHVDGPYSDYPNENNQYVLINIGKVAFSQFKGFFLKDGDVYAYDSKVPHQGTPAKESGQRLLIRFNFSNYLKPKPYPKDLF